MFMSVTCTHRTYNIPDHRQPYLFIYFRPNWHMICCYQNLKIWAMSIISLKISSIQNSTFSCLMFCLPCIIVYQHTETNVMHFSFNLLRIKSLYMFRTLLAHPQVMLNKRHLVHCVSQLNVARMQTANVPQPTGITRTQYIKCRCAVPPEDELVILETCSSPWISINWMNSASRWFHCSGNFSCFLNSAQHNGLWIKA
jgi:hypothetical protein